jgi:hypothetical protein
MAPIVEAHRAVHSRHIASGPTRVIWLATDAGYTVCGLTLQLRLDF